MLPMGYTNTLLVFNRVLQNRLQHQIFQGRWETFIDDVAANAPSRSMYANADGKPKMSVILEVCLYIY